MNFKVIYKGKTHESVVADNMTAIDSEKLQSAFMVVATERVEDVEKPYLAAQLKENEALICTKGGATKVEASNLDEALKSDVPVITKYTLTYSDPSGKATSIPDATIVNNGTVLNELPNAVVDTEEYEFNGWKIDGELVTLPYTVIGDVTFVADITNVVKYTVSFTDPDNHASSMQESIIVKEGTKLEEGSIEDPVATEGWIFDSWYVGSNQLHYPLTVTHDFTLKATWRASE